MKKCDKTGYELRVVNWGELSKAWSFTFLSASLGGKESPCPWVEGGRLSHGCLMTCSRGESVFPACAVSPISIKRYLVCQDAVFGGSMSWTPSPPSLESTDEKEKGKTSSADQIRSDQSLSHVRLFVTPWTAARQASLSITNSWSSLRLMFIESVMPSMSSPSPLAPNPSQHQSLFQWVNSSHEVAKVLEFQL